MYEQKTKTRTSFLSKTECDKAIDQWDQVVNEEKHLLNDYLKDGCHFSITRDEFDAVFNSKKDKLQNDFFNMCLGLFPKADGSEGFTLGLVVELLDENNSPIESKEYLTLMFQDLESSTVFCDFKLDISGIIFDKQLNVEGRFSNDRSNNRNQLKNMISALTAADEVLMFKRSKIAWVASTHSSKIVRKFRVPVKDIKSEFGPMITSNDLKAKLRLDPSESDIQKEVIADKHKIKAVKVFFGLRTDDITHVAVPNLLFIADIKKSSIKNKVSDMISTMVNDDDDNDDPPLDGATRDFTTPCPPFCHGHGGK